MTRVTGDTNQQSSIYTALRVFRHKPRCWSVEGTLWAVLPQGFSQFRISHQMRRQPVFYPDQVVSYSGNICGCYVPPPKTWATAGRINSILTG